MGFDPSIVSQIGRFLVRVLLCRSVRSPFVGFVSVVDSRLKSFDRLYFIHEATISSFEHDHPVSLVRH